MSTRYFIGWTTRRLLRPYATKLELEALERLVSKEGGNRCDYEIARDVGCRVRNPADRKAILQVLRVSEGAA